MDMIKKLKKIVRCLTFVSIIILVVDELGQFCAPIYSSHGIVQIEAFHRIEEETLDVIVYGSSHAWKGVDSRILSDDYGLNAYNYGCNWQSIDTTLLFLQDSLTTQSPKIALIETYFVGKNSRDVELNGEIYYTRAIPFSIDKCRYVHKCFGKNIQGYMSYFFPLIVFRENIRNSDKDNYTDSDIVNAIEKRGFFDLSHSQEQEPPNYADFSQKGLNDASIESLNEIVKTCSDNEISIIFFTCPYSGEYNYVNAMEAYAEDNNCKYINFFELQDDIGFSWSDDLADAGHLNSSGAKKIADYLGNYIAMNY